MSAPVEAAPIGPRTHPTSDRTPTEGTRPQGARRARHATRSLAVAAVGAGAACGLGLAHLLEIPGKHQLTADQFLAVHHHMYRGYAIVGGFGEILALIAMVTAWAWLRTVDHAAARLAAWGGVALAGALALFAVGLAPLNSQIAGWTPSTIGADWHSVRNRWETFHVLSFAMTGVALALAIRAHATVRSPTTAEAPRLPDET